MKTITREERTKVYDVEDSFQWREWVEKIPYIKFPSDWKVKPIPPFGGTIVRFQVNTPDYKNVSVYLDCYSMLGYYGGEPYWEVYPYYGDVGRCGMQETGKLIGMIAEAGDGYQ